MKCMERSPADPGTEVGLGSGCSMVGGARPKIRPTQSDLHSYKGVENKANSASKPIAESKDKNSVKNIIDFFIRFVVVIDISVLFMLPLNTDFTLGIGLLAELALFSTPL